MKSALFLSLLIVAQFAICFGLRVPNQEGSNTLQKNDVVNSKENGRTQEGRQDKPLNTPQGKEGDHKHPEEGNHEKPQFNSIKSNSVNASQGGKMEGNQEKHPEDQEHHTQGQDNQKGAPKQDSSQGKKQRVKQQALIDVHNHDSKDHPAHDHHEDHQKVNSGKKGHPKKDDNSEKKGHPEKEDNSEKKQASFLQTAEDHDDHQEHHEQHHSA